MSKSRKKHRRSHDTANGKPLRRKMTLEMCEQAFNEQCDICGEPLIVVKLKNATKKRGDVITATCQNENFKGFGVKCENWCIETRFRHLPWC